MILLNDKAKLILDKINQIEVAEKRDMDHRNYYYQLTAKSDYIDTKEHKNFVDLIGSLTKELEELGIVFMCADYGSEYCLDLIGVKKVIKAIFGDVDGK